jgi:hypothetical protein
LKASQRSILRKSQDISFEIPPPKNTQMRFNFLHQPSGVHAAQKVEAHPIPFAPYT